MANYEQTFFDYLNGVKQLLKAQPIVLGGVSGGSGGSGGPPGGFVGQLPQNKVAYDTTEAESSGTTTSGSLLDNLNHIRYRLATIEDAYVIGAGLTKITVGTTEPTSPNIGDLWVDTN